MGVPAAPQGNQLELIRALEDQGLVPGDVADLFHHVRKAGNDAAHQLVGSAGEAVHALKVARQIGVWFHRTFADPAFRPGVFVAPSPTRDPTTELQARVEALRGELDASQRA